jgi:tRNA wybutosine-synthesizing protein 1
MSATIGSNMKDIKTDEPEELMDGFIESQRLLLTGFKGNSKVDRKKWEEAQNPTNIAISLAGEPTLYERLSDLIEEAHKRNMYTFLVTNGTMPNRLKDLKENPKHLYISLCAPDKETYKKIHNPLISDGWERLNKSLELMNSFDSKTVLRLTLVKGLNMKNPDKYAKLIEKANPDFIEPKGYVWVGESQTRLKMDNMPYHEDVVEFAEQLSKETGYNFKDQFKPSRVCLLTKK